MASTTAALLLLLGVLCVGFASAEIAVDCCLTVSKKPMPLQRLQSYTLQEAGKGCQISATGFITKLGRTLCVSHPDDAKWVRRYIKHLDESRPRAR
ncbi:C-C motif chemokine 13-like [Cyclopterus lumpus]|uniref:Chemokine interleukin-8-like domain-containing protein n=1 Tax=Cyclopterus lumpus TaxID=8103 RepID=A0A8C2XQS3_CYCLU|nr:C-C motif chemokine 13-like [Cyclopterus lumpus]